MSDILNLELITTKFKKEISVFQDYLNKNSVNIENNFKELQNFFYEDIQDNPKDSNLLEVVYNEDFKMHGLLFKSLLYSGLLTSVFSFFEHYLIIICNEYINHTKSKLKLKDINASNNIYRANKYFKLVLEVDLDSLDKYWLPISEFWQIRNCIVHRNSNFVEETEKPVQEQKLYSILKKTKNILTDEDEGCFYIISNDEISNLITNINTYVLKLCDQINNMKIERSYDLPF